MMTLGDLVNPGLWDGILSRNSKRAFLPKEIPKQLLQELLKGASNAPSSCNAQPWTVEVVTGASLKRLTEMMVESFESKAPATDDLSEQKLQGVYHDRMAQVGKDIFTIKKIDRHNKEQRKANLMDNARFFGAPCTLIVHMDERLSERCLLDIGMFIQNLVLACEAYGLGAICQGFISRQSEVLRKFLNWPAFNPSNKLTDMTDCTQKDPHRLIAAVVTLGFPDPSDPTNAFHAPKIGLDEFVTFHE
eukprot:GCRY01000067.1.p1 GENE.GCRY01000067.1~~GCRY01000067.1.p1  ORF type:complete len:247 (+),score=37.99 GCRY01000067.1:122-862(+)